MKLSESTKTKLREIIENEVRKVPDGQRIKLDTELLEELIFFHGTAKMDDSEYEVRFKVPIWTGEFLSKIDLSELSFKNVLTTRLTEFVDLGAELSDETEKSLMEFEYEDHFGNKRSDQDFPYVLEDKSILGDYQLRTPFINFRNTNINIDFSETIDRWLACWDLSGVDLSNSSVEKLYCIDGCNLSRTNIKAADTPWLENEPFDEDKENQDSWFSVHNTNLSNNDLSGININVINTRSNNFANTGVQIDCLSDVDESVKTEFENSLKKGHLCGCYLDGVLINSGQTLEDILREKKKKNIIDSEKEEQLLSELPGIIESQLPKTELSVGEQKERLFDLKHMVDDISSPSYDSQDQEAYSDFNSHGI